MEIVDLDEISVNENINESKTIQPSSFMMSNSGDKDDEAVISREWKTPAHVFQYDEGGEEMVSEISNKSFVFDEKIVFVQKEDIVFLTFNEETSEIKKLVIKIQSIKIYEQYIKTYAPLQLQHLSLLNKNIFNSNCFDPKDSKVYC